MENRKDIITLIQRYRQGTASADEVRHLLEYIQSGADTDLIERSIAEGLLDEPSEGMQQSEEVYKKLDMLFEQIIRKRDIASGGPHKPERIDPIEHKRTFYIRGWLPVIAAAIVIMAISIMWVYFDDQIIRQPTEMAHDIGPGTNRATLTLADGRTIDLNENQSGIIIGDLLMYEDGSLIDPSLNEGIGEHLSDGIMMLSLSTPRGGSYHITLSDGTQVWLNAASTLTYPNRFSNGKRQVEISGEAYFSVTEDKSWSFKVISRGQEIEVLGTSFNVSAYDDETTTKTTLVEGAVQVTHPNSETAHKLMPGQQAILLGTTIDIQQVDIMPYTAWKDGLMVWTRVSLPEVFRQIERWYDVEFEAPPNEQTSTLSAAVPREVNLSEVLAALELNTDLKFTIEGRRVKWVR